MDEFNKNLLLLAGYTEEEIAGINLSKASMVRLITKKANRRKQMVIIHNVLMKNGPSSAEPSKSVKNKYERRHSMSMWHTDWNEIADRGGGENISCSTLRFI